MEKEKNNFFYKRPYMQKWTDWMLGVLMPSEYYDRNPNESREIKEKIKT